MLTLPDLRDAIDLSFHHIGVACRNLDSEQRAFEHLGYRPETGDIFDPIQGVHIRFLIGGGPRLELLSNNHEPGVLTSWLRKGIRFYHLAYETPELAGNAEMLLRAGAKEVSKPVPAVAFEGRLVSFYVLPNLSMIELISTI